MEALRVFLFMSKIDWWLVCGTNMLMNYMHYTMILNNEDFIEKNHIFAFIFPLILTNSLPFFSYFKDRGFKQLFYQLINYDQTLKCFKELITKIIPNQIIIMNEERNDLLFCNDEVQRFFKTEEYSKIMGYLKQISVQNKSFFEILEEIHYTKEDNVFIDYQTSIQFLNSYNKNLKNVNEKDNENNYYFSIKIGRIYWQNEKAYLILMSDVSAIKLVEKLKELDTYKDQLLATVSHDLRTPLNGVLGVIELLLETIKEKALRKLLKIAMRCTNLLLFMINDILDFSQINNGKLRLFFSNYNVSDLIKEVIDLIKFQCNRKNIQFLLDLPQCLKNQLLVCDYRRVQQVLLNLISNALKFTTQGFIKLSIHKITEKSKNFLQFSVEDTGIGIKEEDIKKLFQLFGKLEENHMNINNSRGPLNKNGTGLGLVISQRLVEMLSGDEKEKIVVSSQYGKGSVFTFRLPLDVPEDEEISDEILEKEANIFESLKSYNLMMNSQNLAIIDESNSVPSVSRFNSPNDKKRLPILLVDDDQINLFVISKYLESFNLTYKTAHNGKMAVEIVKSERNFSVIFMDCYMPIMNGFDAAREIKELFNKKIIFSEIPIFGLTASTSGKDLDLCKECGMKDVLTKPVAKKQMKEKIQEILKIRIYERNGVNTMINKLGDGLFSKKK